MKTDKDIAAAQLRMVRDYVHAAQSRLNDDMIRAAIQELDAVLLATGQARDRMERMIDLETDPDFEVKP